MASGGGGCSASGRLPPPFPVLEPESEGAVGGSEPEAGDSDTEGEDIFTGAAEAVSSHPSGQAGGRPQRKARLSEGWGGWAEWARRDLTLVTVVVAWVLDEHRDVGPGFSAPGRTVRSEGCGGFSAEIPDSEEPPRRAFGPALRPHGPTGLVCWWFPAGLI